MANTTKRMLSMSLKKLLSKTTLDSITIQDITDDAEVSRKTFYYHFQDIMDVVEWCARQQTERMVERSLAADSPQEALSELIRSTAENYSLLRKLMSSQRREQIERILGEAARSYLEELMRRRPTAFRANYGDADIALDFLTFGLVGMLLKHCGEPGLDPDKLAEQMIRILNSKLELFEEK